MGKPDLAMFKATLATRGLSVVGFGGGTLRLTYNPSGDQELKKGAVALTDLSGFATQAINAQLDGTTPPLFPGLREILVS